MLFQCEFGVLIWMLVFDGECWGLKVNAGAWYKVIVFGGEPLVFEVECWCLMYSRMFKIKVGC